MNAPATVERLVNLLDDRNNVFLNMSVTEAKERLASGDPQKVREIDGQFALLDKQGKKVRMARSIGRPLRYFIAKRHDGPCLVAAERIDEIHAFLKSEGLDGQFHPSYTRMVPAHYLVEVHLVGCPDPNPTYTRYFTPKRESLPADLDVIAEAYVGALAEAIRRWLTTIESDQPVGVLFSGGIDSGAVLILAYHQLLALGQSPARLKAFTLSADAGGEDFRQAMQFVQTMGFPYLLEAIEVDRENLDFRDAIKVLEDYKPLDVQSALMALALCRGIRSRYPDWCYLIDGDGGDENLKDYPIEENTELTIRSVLNNLMLYQEGWGVGAIKHSLTYTGGQSRGHVRSYAPVSQLGFKGFSPYALPNVIEVAEGIPYIQLTQWSHDRLYSLKGEIIRRGIKKVTGLEMPIFPKRRFQKGVMDERGFADCFPSDPMVYRQAFASLYESA